MPVLRKVNHETLWGTRIETFHWVSIFDTLEVMLVWNQEEKNISGYTENRDGWEVTAKWLVAWVKCKAARFWRQATQCKWEKQHSF